MDERADEQARMFELAAELSGSQLLFSSEEIPPVLSGFEVVAELGRGATGVVYRARDRAGREVALKLLSAPETPGALARFRREGEVTASLRHPGIVRVHSGWEVFTSSIRVQFTPSRLQCARRKAAGGVMVGTA